MLQPKKIFTFLSYLSVILTLPLIPFGALVRLKGAGLACPDWPFCYGDLVPSNPSTEIILEVGHRYVATILGMVILIMCAMVFICKQLQSARTRTAWALIIVVLQGLLGALTVTMTLNPYIVALHLIGGNFLLWVLIFNLYSLYQSQFAIQSTKENKQLLSHKSVLYLNIFFFFMLLSGGLNSGYSAGYFCDAFPLCHSNDPLTISWNSESGLTTKVHSESVIMNETIIPQNQIEWIHMLHRIIVISGSMMIFYFIFFYWLQVKNKYVFIFAVSLCILLILEIFVGIINALFKIPIPISALHNFLAALINCCLCYFYFISRKIH